MKYENSEKMVAIPVTSEYYQRVRVAAALRGLNVASFGRQLLEKVVPKSFEPNKNRHTPKKLRHYRRKAQHS